MRARIDISGQRFGRLTAIELVVIAARGNHTKWKFSCDCGKDTVCAIDSVRSGDTKSCGCLAKESVRKRSMTHGHASGLGCTLTLKSYHAAKSRCSNPNNIGYHRYGGRGIKMCEEWMSSFEAFLRDMGERPKGHSLERLDVNGNYEPINCTWSTHSVQCRNRRNNVFYEFNGQKMILKDIAGLAGVPVSFLRYKIEHKEMTIDEAICSYCGKKT